MKLSRAYYLNGDVIEVARDLLGKILFTNFNGVIKGGMITETEAYEGVTDGASHAFGNRRTDRTEVMFGEGGRSYVYLCYGIHHLFNVVTNVEGIPHAILIRGILPIYGKEKIHSDTGKNHSDYRNFNGPGKVTKALGIRTNHSGYDLTGGRIWIEDKGIIVDPASVIRGPRIGVDYAGEDAKLEYRFRVREGRIHQLAASQRQ